MNGRLLALTCVLLSLGASGALSLVRRAHRVDAAHLDRAAAIVRAEHRASDLIVVTPYYQSGPRERLGDLPLVELRRVVEDDLRAYRRLWLLELDAVGADAALGAAVSELGAVEARQRFGNVALSRVVVRAPERSVFELRRDLASVRVTARYPDGDVWPCDVPGEGRWSCKRDAGWSWVGRVTTTVHDAPRACTWMHPVRGGGALWLDTPALPRGGTPVLGHGFTMSGARLARAPVRVRLLEGERVLYDVMSPVERDWRSQRLSEVEAGRALRLEVSTTNNDAAHFCVDLRVVEPDAS